MSKDVVSGDIQLQLDPGGNFGTKLYHRACLALRQRNRACVHPVLDMLVTGHQFSWTCTCVDVCAYACSVGGRRQLLLLTQKVAGVNCQRFLSGCTKPVQKSSRGHRLGAACAMRFHPHLSPLVQRIRFSVIQTQIVLPDHPYSSMSTIILFKFLTLPHLPVFPLMKFTSPKMPPHLFTANTSLYVHKTHVEPHHLPVVFSHFCNLFIFPPLSSYDKFIPFDSEFNYVLGITRNNEADFVSHRNEPNQLIVMSMYLNYSMYISSAPARLLESKDHVFCMICVEQRLVQFYVLNV